MDTNKGIVPLRLASHQLLATKAQTPAEIVSWMGAIQAQDYTMANWAIGIRLENYTGKMVADAFNQGQFLRTHVLRPTWHFVSPANIRHTSISTAIIRLPCKTLCGGRGYL
ncbi:MAG: winged helix DNA-binding domain-containing protein [Candidatus Symbiothrix sp.]|jgi:hypothetical protein|nr:winged helix DNA-binding domain-containing protein [Candidatus Symbiothrix sp.]